MKGMGEYELAIAEPALRQFGQYKLRNLRVRGGSLLGTATGIGIGIGESLLRNYDLTMPWSQMEQPPIRKRSAIGDGFSSQTYASSYQHKQALRNTFKRGNRFKRYKQHGNCQCCTCSCR